MSDAAKITSLEKKLDVSGKSIADLEQKVSVLTGQNQELRNKAAEARREQNLREPDVREKGRHEEMKKSMREEINRLNAEYTSERKLHQNAVREREKVVQEANQINRDWVEKDQRMRAEKAELEVQVRDLEAWLSDEKSHVQRQRQVLQALQEEVGTQKSSCRAAEVERDRVRDDVYELNKRIDILSSTNEKLRLEGTEHREQVKSLRSKISTLQVESEQHLQQHYAQEGIMASHIQSLKAVDEEKRALEECLMKKDLEIAESADKMAELEQEVILQRSAKEEVEETLQRERSRADREQKVSSDIDTSYRQLQTRYDGLFERHQEKERECIFLRTQNTTLERDLEGVKEERAKISDTLKKIEGKKNSLEERLNVREREVSLSQNQMSKETQALSDQVEDLTSQLTVTREAKERAEESVQKAEGYNDTLQKELDEQLQSYKDISHKHDEVCSKLYHEQEKLVMAVDEIDQLKATVAELKVNLSLNDDASRKQLEKQQRQIDLLESQRVALEAINKQFEARIEEADGTGKSQRVTLNRRIQALEAHVSALQADKEEGEGLLSTLDEALRNMGIRYTHECELREKEGTAFRQLQRELANTVESLTKTKAQLNQVVEEGRMVTKSLEKLGCNYRAFQAKASQNERSLKLRVEMQKADMLRLNLCASILVAQREKRDHAAAFYESELDKVGEHYITVARSLSLVMKEAEKQFISLEKMLGDDPAAECRKAVESHRAWKQETPILKQELLEYQDKKEIEISELRDQMTANTTIFKSLRAQMAELIASTNNVDGVADASSLPPSSALPSSTSTSVSGSAQQEKASASRCVSQHTSANTKATTAAADKRGRSEETNQRRHNQHYEEGNNNNDETTTEEEREPVTTKGLRFEKERQMTGVAAASSAKAATTAPTGGGGQGATTSRKLSSASPALITDSNLGSRQSSCQQQRRDILHSVSRPLDEGLQSQNPVVASSSVSPVPISPPPSPFVRNRALPHSTSERRNMTTSSAGNDATIPSDNNRRAAVSGSQNKSVRGGGGEDADDGLVEIGVANRRALDEWTSTNSSFYPCSLASDAKQGDSVSPTKLSGGVSPFKTGRVSTQQHVAAAPSRKPADFEDGQAFAHKY